MRWFLLVVSLSLIAAAVPASAFVFKLVTGANLSVPVPSQSIASTSISCGSSCSATAGTGSTIGTLSATLSPATPAFTGSWSLQTTGSVSGITCDNSGFFSVSGNSLNISSSATAATYNPCYVATQAGLGGSPRANTVSVTVNSSSTTACDVGPPYIGSIPTPAQTAGFTHCVANFDFTQTASWTDTVGTHQWSNKSSWLDCAGAGSNTILYAIQNSNCNDFIITTDGSTQVLKTIYTSSDTNGESWLATDSTVGDPNSAGLRTHTGYYVDNVGRMDAASFNTCRSYMSNCGQNDIWQIQTPQQSGAPDIEFDLVEFFGNPNGGATGGAHPIGLVDQNYTANYSGYDRTVYNTYGGLNTVVSSGSPNYEACYVFNGISKSLCGSTTISGLSTVTIEFYITMTGPYAADSDPNKCSSQTCSPTGTVTSYTQRHTIWSCASYSSVTTSGGPCYSSSLVTY